MEDVAPLSLPGVDALHKVASQRPDHFPDGSYFGLEAHSHSCADLINARGCH